jgi:hypothetical protein
MKAKEGYEGKVERYDWAKPGDRGRQQNVAVADLRIDPAYQREVVSERNTLGIAKDFSWVAFNSLVVMERKNGQMYVVDGFQRLSAVRRRGDIFSVPCRVFHSEGQEHEARAFYALNVNRRPVNSYAKFRAAVAGGEHPHVGISEWLATQGLKVEDAKPSWAVRFPSVLLYQWKIDDEACKRAVVCQREIVGDERLSVDVQRGLFWLIRAGVRVEDHAERIKCLGGQAAMRRAIRTNCIETGLQANDRASGIGLLRLINFKKRHKIRIADVAAENGEGDEV